MALEDAMDGLVPVEGKVPGQVNSFSGLVPVGSAPTARDGLLAAENKDPDKYGKALTLADATGLQVPAIEDQYDHVNYLTGIVGYNDLEQTHPATATVLSNPDLAAVAKPDIESLKKIEETLWGAKRKTFAVAESGDMLTDVEETSYLRDAVRKIVPDTYRSWVTGQVQQEIARLESQVITGQTPKGYAERISVLEQAMKDLGAKTIEGFFDRGYQGAIQILPQFIEQGEARIKGAIAGGLLTGVTTAAAGAILGSAATAPVGGVGAAPVAAAGFLGGFAPGAIAGQETAGILYSFELEGGLAYNEFKNIVDAEGRPIPDEIARGAAIGVGAINAAIEVAQFNTLAKMVPGAKQLVNQAIRESVVESLKREETRQALTAIAKLYTKGVVTESLQETAQQFSNILGEEAGKKLAEITGNQSFEHKTLPQIGQELWNEFSQSVGAFMYLGLPGAAFSIKPALDSVQKSQKHAEFFNALNETLAGNPVRERYSPAIRTLVEQVKATASANGEEIGNIGVPATALQTLFQTKPEDLEQFLQAAEIAPGEYSNAISQDRDIEIPLEVFAQKIAGTPLGQKLINDLRLFPGDATVNEAKKEAEFLQSVLSQRATEGIQAMADDAELRATIESFRDDVRLSGMTREDTDAQLSILATRAKKAAVEWTAAGVQMTPAQWIQEHLGLVVQKEASSEQDASALYQAAAKRVIYNDARTLKVAFEDTGVEPSLNDRGQLRKYLESINPAEIRKLKVESSDEYLNVLKSIVQETFPEGADLRFRTEDGRALNYEHFLKDAARREYVHSLPETLRSEDVRVEFTGRDAQKAYYIKKYFDPDIQKDIWDMVVLHGDEVRTKFARAGRKGAGYIESVMDRAGKEASPSASPVRSIENASTSPETNSNISQDGEKSNKETGSKALSQDTLGQVSFRNNQAIITLFESANFSTFLHEIGHVFIRDMEALIQTGAASAQVQADYEFLQKFISDQPDYRSQQEKLARAWETYLLEGKAPTADLQGVFARTRAWFTAIYRSLKDVLGTQINDEIRGVFDRMLMAEDEVENAALYHNIRSSLDGLVNETATEAERIRVEKLKMRRTQEAVEKRTSTLLKAYFRAIGGRASFLEKAMAEVSGQPVYQALADASQNGGILVGDVEDRGVKTINKRHGDVASTTGKVDPEILAAKHGFADAQEMLKAMRRAEALRLVAGRKAKELFTAEETRVRKTLESEALSSEYGVALPGDADFHSEAALDVLLAEAELLRRKQAQIQKRAGSLSRITARVLRDKVRADLEKMPVRKAVQYTRNSAAEARASRAAEAAFLTGNIEEALRQKQMEAYYHAMVLESVRARDEMAKLETRVSRFIKGAGKIEYGHREQFLALAHRYGLTDRGPADPDSISSFDAFVASVAQDDPNGAPMFSTFLLKGEKAGSYRNLSLEEARELRSAIEWVVGRGSDHFQQLLSEKDISIATYADKALRLPKDIKSKPVPAQREVLQNVKKAINGGLAKISQLQFYLRAMDGYTNLSGTNIGLNEQMFQWLADAGNNEKRIFHAGLYPKYKEIFKAIRAGQKRIEKERGAFFDIEGVPVTEAMKDVGINEWTSEHVFCAALNMGNGGNRAALLQGYELNESQVQALASILTEADWKAVQAIWDLIDTQYTPMNAAYFAINNIHTKKVEAEAFQVRTADGKTVDAAGGYYPLIFDHKLSDRAENFRQEDLLKNSEAAITYTPAAKSGFTNKRTGGLLPPILSLAVIPQHLYDTVHYYTHAAAVRDIDRITRVPEWKAEFARINGRDAYAEIRPWLKNVARPEKPFHDVYDSFVSRQRNLASIAILGFNLKTASKQFLDVFHAMRDLGPGWVAKGMWSSWSNWKNAAAEVRAVSPYMAQRALVIDREMREVLLKASPKQKTFMIHGEEYSWNDVMKFSFKFIEMADAAVTIPTWKAAYAKAQSLAMSPEESITFADNAVRVTQPGADVIDQVALQRSTNWTRLFSMFISPALRVQNRMRYFWGAWRNGKMSTSDYFGHVLYELVAPSVARWAFYAAFIGAVGGGDDEKKKASVSDVFFNFLDQALGGFPILNLIPSAMEYGKGSPSPALEGVERLLKFAGSGVKATKSIWDDELVAGDEWAKFAVAMADALTFEMGVGYTGRIVKTFAEGFEDLSEGKTVNPLRLVIKVPKKDRQ